MSLFKLKNLWAQSFPEEFDERHLCVGRVDNSPAVGLGSFSGSVRVFLIAGKSPLQANLIYQNSFEGSVVAVDFISHPE